MSFISQSQKILCIALFGVVALVLAFPLNASPNLPELLLSVADTNVTSGDTSAWISVFFQNYQDTLADSR